jgi:hypothetical protein
VSLRDGAGLWAGILNVHYRHKPRVLVNSLQSLGAMQRKWNIGTRHHYHQEGITGERNPKEYDMNSITFSGLSGRMVSRTGKVLVMLKSTCRKDSPLSGSMSFWVEVAVHECPITQVRRQDRF